MSDRKIIDVALADDPLQGGTAIIAYGKFGSGKSKLLQTWAINDLARGHTVIMRSKDADNWHDLASRYPIHVITPGTDYSATMEKDGVEEKLPDNVTFISVLRPDDAARAIKKGVLNVIYVEGKTPVSEAAWWTIFVREYSRVAKGWTTLCFDEIRDVFPAKVTGEVYTIYDKFIFSLANLRKKRIHIRASSHTFHDVFYGVAYKFQYTVYMQGSLMLLKKKTAVKYQSTINRECDDTHFIIDNISGYEVCEFKRLPQELASGSTVNMNCNGEGWSINDYPILMFTLGLKPVVKCVNPECQRPVYVREGQDTCYYCGSDLMLVDKVGKGTPPRQYFPGIDAPDPPGRVGDQSMRSIDRGQNQNMRPEEGSAPVDLNTLNTQRNVLGKFANYHNMSEHDFVRLLLDIPANDLTDEQIQEIRKVFNMEFEIGGDLQDIYDQAKYEINRILRRGGNANKKE